MDDPPCDGGERRRLRIRTSAAVAPDPDPQCCPVRSWDSSPQSEGSWPSSVAEQGLQSGVNVTRKRGAVWSHRPN
jgi:hypothetical protein